jgi:hypothetical protein
MAAQAAKQSPSLACFRCVMGSKTFGTGGNLGYELRSSDQLSSLGIDIDRPNFANVTT